MATPPVRLRQGLHDTGNVSLTTHSTHFMAAPPVRFRQGLRNTGNVSLTTHSTHFMAAPPVRLRQGLHDTGNVSLTTHSTHFIATPPVRLRQGLHNTGNVSLTTHSTHFMATPPVRLRQRLHNTGNISFNHALNTFYSYSTGSTPTGPAKQGTFHLTTHSTHFMAAPPVRLQQGLHNTGNISFNHALNTFYGCSTGSTPTGPAQHRERFI